MSLVSKTCTLFMVVLTTACSSPVKQASSFDDAMPYNSEELRLIERLRVELPGYYSNFTQFVEAAGAKQTTTDLTIRELITDGDPVFLFEAHQRSAGTKQYDLYWSQINSDTRQLELQFARLSGSELSNSAPDSLAIAKQRALPGCLIEMQISATQFEGQTQAETCQFENPALGHLRLFRSIDLEADIDGSKTLNITNLELKPGETVGEGIPVLRFQKHDAYSGTISISPQVLSSTTHSDQWQTSARFNLYDDGRVANLLNADMKSMDYTIKLSKLHWRENEPAYLKLEVIQVKSGEIMAYRWYKPDSELMEFDSDWVKVELNLNDIEGPSAN